jgi:hypothetical protein
MLEDQERAVAGQLVQAMGASVRQDDDTGGHLALSDVEEDGRGDPDDRDPARPRQALDVGQRGGAVRVGDDDLLDVPVGRPQSTGGDLDALGGEEIAETAAMPAS